MGVANSRKSLSPILFRLWLAGLIGSLSCGCLREAEVDPSGSPPARPLLQLSDPLPAGADQTLDSSRAAASASSPSDLTLDRSDWDAAIAWAASDDSGRVLEVFEPIEPSWVSEMTSELALRGAVFRRGGVDMAGLELLRLRFMIEHLAVHESGWGPAEFAAVANLPSLRRLSVDGATVGDSQIAELSRLTDLQSLRLGAAQPNANSLPSFKRLTRLEHLHLIGFSVDEETERAIGSLGELRSLYLDECSFGSDWPLRLQRLRPELHLHIDGGHPD